MMAQLEMQMRAGGWQQQQRWPLIERPLEVLLSTTTRDADLRRNSLRDQPGQHQRAISITMETALGSDWPRMKQSEQVLRRTSRSPSYRPRSISPVT